MKVRPVVATSWMLGELKHRLEVATDALTAAKAELAELEKKEENSIIKGAHEAAIKMLKQSVSLYSEDVEAEQLRVSALDHHEAPRIALEFEV